MAQAQRLNVASLAEKPPNPIDSSLAHRIHKRVGDCGPKLECIPIPLRLPSKSEFTNSKIKANNPLEQSAQIEVRQHHARPRRPSRPASFEITAVEKNNSVFESSIGAVEC